MSLFTESLIERRAFLGKKEVAFVKFSNVVLQVWNVFKWLFLFLTLAVFGLGIYDSQMAAATDVVKIWALMIPLFVVLLIVSFVSSMLVEKIADDMRDNLSNRIKDKYDLLHDDVSWVNFPIEDNVHIFKKIDGEKVFAMFSFTDELNDVVLSDEKGDELEKSEYNGVAPSLVSE